MAGITLQQAEAQLALWMDLDAKLAVRSDDQYTVQGRSYTVANRGEIRANIKFWDEQCKRLDRGGIRVRGAIAL
jgi:hypothetical protein